MICSHLPRTSFGAKMLKHWPCTYLWLKNISAFSFLHDELGYIWPRQIHRHLVFFGGGEIKMFLCKYVYKEYQKYLQLLLRVPNLYIQHFTATERFCFCTAVVRKAFYKHLPSKNDKFPTPQCLYENCFVNYVVWL